MTAFKKWDVLQHRNRPDTICVVTSDPSSGENGEGWRRSADWYPDAEDLWTKIGVVKLDPKPISVGDTVVAVRNRGDKGLYAEVLWRDEKWLLLKFADSLGMAPQLRKADGVYERVIT